MKGLVERATELANFSKEINMTSINKMLTELVDELERGMEILREGICDQPCEDYEDDCYNCRAWKWIKKVTE